MATFEEYEQIIEEWRNEYITDRNSKKGWEILEKLANLQGPQNESDEISPETGAAFDDFSTSKLITLIMSDIDSKDLLVTHQILLLQFIPTAVPNILRHVVRTIREKEGAVALLKSEAVAVGIAIARRVAESEVTEEIARLLALLVDNEAICDELKTQLANSNTRDNSVVRSRIFTIASEHAKVSTDATHIKWLHTEIMESVLDRKDVLTQLDALDILVDVALTGRENAKTLFESGIVKKIYELMEWSRDAPDGGDLYFYGTRFLCYMARSYPEVLKAFPDFVQRLLMEVRMFDQLSIVTRLGVFDHFASLCYSVEAKQTLDEIFKDSKDLENTLGAAGAACAMGTMELKCRTLQALTLIFENSTDSISSTWYERLGGKALTHVSIGAVKKPFPEMKNAIYDFWQQLFLYPTVVQQFIAFQGFIDWALDAQSEAQPEHEHRKRQIIRRIIDLSDKSDAFNIDPELVERLRKYLQPATAPAPRVEEMAL